MADQTNAEGIPAGRCAHLSAGSSEEVQRHDLSVLLLDALITSIGRGEFRPRQTRQLPRAVDLKGRLLSCQSY